MYSVATHVPGGSRCDCGVAGCTLSSTFTAVRESLRSKNCRITKIIRATKGCRCARKSFRGKKSVDTSNGHI